MRIVVDTNIMISALLNANGTPAHIVSLVESHQVQLAMSHEVLDELSRVMRYAKFKGALDIKIGKVERLLHLLRTATYFVEDVPPIPMLIDDPKDTMFLALAIASGADLIVSGDRHLLGHPSYAGIPIVTARTAIEILSGTG